MMSAAILSRIRNVVPGIKLVNVTLNSCGYLHVIVSIEKMYQGHPIQVMDAIWASRPYVHTIVVVDEEVDPFNLGQVEWAISTYVSPAKHVTITSKGAQSFKADVTGKPARAGSTVSRMGVDATRDEAWPHIPVAVHKKVLKKVKANWDTYFSQDKSG
jgi:UbiD family decarboxylase